LSASAVVAVFGPRGEGSKRIIPPSKAQLRTLVEAAPDDFRLMLIFAASTGARAAEQWAARWRDLDLDKCELRISRRVDAYGEVGAPKTTAGVRTVPLSAHLVAMLKAHKIKSKFSKPEDLVFTNSHGHHIGHDNLVKRRFLPLFEATKAARFNWHGLRHFAVSTGSRRRSILGRGSSPFNRSMDDGEEGKI